jgi:hypothetical protein
MGPRAAKSFAGQALINLNARPAERSKQEIDYGRRGSGAAVALSFALSLALSFAPSSQRPQLP